MECNAETNVIITKVLTTLVANKLKIGRDKAIESLNEERKKADAMHKVLIDIIVCYIHKLPCSRMATSMGEVELTATFFRSTVINYLDKQRQKKKIKTDKLAAERVNGQ